jgi:hypothetical protein
VLGEGVLPLLCCTTTTAWWAAWLDLLHLRVTEGSQ